MDQNYMELKRWLDDTRDVPLEAMDAFFDARIGDYEEHMARWKPHYAWLAQLLAEEADRRGGMDTLLDIGCGTGLELDGIFARLPKLRVTGVDLAGEMLARLRQKHGHRALTTVQADYFRYDPGENCFDAAVAFETLHHFTAEKKREVFEIIRRSLKPGGVFYECDYIATSRDIEDLVFAEAARRRARDGIATDTFVHFDTPLTLAHELEALRAAGFSSVELVGFLACDDHTAMIRAVK